MAVSRKIVLMYLIASVIAQDTMAAKDGQGDEMNGEDEMKDEIALSKDEMKGETAVEDIDGEGVLKTSEDKGTMEDDGKEERKEDDSNGRDVDEIGTKEETENEIETEGSKDSGSGTEKASEISDSDKGGKTDTDKTEKRVLNGDGVRAWVVVGVEEGWEEEAGRVEDSQLTLSALKFNYHVRRESSTHFIKGKQEGEEEENNSEEGAEEEDYLLVYFPRGEGVVQAEAEQLISTLKMADAAILIPDSPINALVGWARAVQRAALDVDATTLAALVVKLRANEELRNKYRAQIDRNSAAFHIMTDETQMDVDGLEISVTGERYEFMVGGQSPVILLATPTSAHGRALLLAVSDYLVGTHHPKTGCLHCFRYGDVINLEADDGELVGVGVFVTRPQPFLQDNLESLLQHGFDPQSVHFYVYNQVEEYAPLVEEFVKNLQDQKLVKNVTLLQVNGGSLSVGAVKNLFLQECARLGCDWYLHVDAIVDLRPVLAAVFTHLGHPVIAPALRIQGWESGTFWREMEVDNNRPTFSWDHNLLLDNEDNENVRGYWHASCIRSIYAIRSDVLKRIPRTPYTKAKDVHPDLAFCEALRDAGLPMIVTTAFPDVGVLVNPKGHASTTPDLDTYRSNPVSWIMRYINPAVDELVRRDWSNVGRPCHEIYTFPVFTERFARELVQLANHVNRWSPATKKDPRKETGLEEVPTVDQFLSDLGLGELLEDLYFDLLRTLQMVAFPDSNSQDKIIYSAVSRFQKGEVSGLSLHHDASTLTFLVLLTPRHLYHGGELEFPQQEEEGVGECVIKGEVGDFLVFPGRLTHPKVLRNVTKGILHHLILLFDNLDNEILTKPHREISVEDY